MQGLISQSGWVLREISEMSWASELNTHRNNMFTLTIPMPNAHK